MTFTFNVLALLAVCATGAMNWFGVEHSFYWIYPWWDILTHVLGGLTMGLWAAAVSSRYELPPRRALFVIVGVGLAFGVAFELWEVVVGVSGGPLDTIKDIIDDALGALAAWLIYRAYK